VAFNREGRSNDDARRRHIYDECHIRKGKDTIVYDGNNKNPQVSCNCMLYDCYIILKKLYLFYDEFLLYS